MTFENDEDGSARYQGSNVLENVQERPHPEVGSQLKNSASGTARIDKTIIAVGGAKGGVGKSALAANLAVGLSLLGQKVVLADLDLGGADVHLYVGVKSLSKTWNDFLDRKADSLEDIMTPTHFEGLSLIGGDSSRLGSENLPYSQKQKILRHLRELEGDYLIVDLGGNSSYNVLDFFLFADHKIVVSGTEPASILDSYSFVKVSFYRFLERFFAEHKSLKDLSRQTKDGSLEQSKNFSLDFIFEQIRERDPAAYAEFKQQHDQFRVSLVINMAESRKDFRIAESVQQVLKEKCFLDVGILGTIPFDKLARKAARSFTPIIVENPRCQPSKAIHQMLAAILLDREKGSSRAELLQKTGLIRGEAKDRIRSDTMTLDGLTLSQINSIYDQSPNLRQSFRKILNIMTT
jgi:flagellar biosynthesis protein FlhG